MLMTLGGGLIAALLHMQLHHQNRDSEPGLTVTDLKGVYHGVTSEAPMLRQLKNGHPKDKTPDGSSTISDEERQILIDWLNSDRISEDYDNLDLGDAAPAEIIAIGCLGLPQPRRCAGRRHRRTHQLRVLGRRESIHHLARYQP
jgi:hypothetical protein